MGTIIGLLGRLGYNDSMQDHAVLVIRSGSKCLFVQRSFTKKTLPGAWAFASGTVEAEETIEETAKREAKEELGLIVSVQKVFASHELPNFNTILHFVLCNLVEGEPIIHAPDEIEAFEWISLSDFFEKYNDSQIGHGLVWLRANTNIWMQEGL